MLKVEHLTKDVGPPRRATLKGHPELGAGRVRGHHGGDPPGVDDGDAVAEAAHQRQVMGGTEDRPSLGADQPLSRPLRRTPISFGKRTFHGNPVITPDILLEADTVT